MHARFHFVMDRSPGCYAIDIMNMVMGRGPVSVYAKGTSPTDTVETTVAAILDYDGVIGTLNCGFEGPRTNMFQSIGTKGQITLDKAFDPDPGDAARVTVSLRDGSTEVFDINENPVTVETEWFSTWARSAGQEVVHQELTEQNLAVRLAIHESLAAGLPRNVEPVHAVEHHLLQEQ
ncbi:Gfo/Idh/MocA family protein [Arthrobacter sp. ZGTC412]|uniref:Gfo/Idh/MocA family protein n=1 Tax=Arthrobacter sp. ZGTC412 TaxID=2058900 RepID=UPI0021581F62|nr:hypothetical protein [Arthrobacter sp. ZGTC412]